MSDELMGGYAAYTTPNATLKDLSNTGAVHDDPASISISISLVTITITIATQ